MSRGKYQYVKRDMSICEKRPKNIEIWHRILARRAHIACRAPFCSISMFIRLFLHIDALFLTHVCLGAPCAHRLQSAKIMFHFSMFIGLFSHIDLSLLTHVSFGAHSCTHIICRRAPPSVLRILCAAHLAEFLVLLMFKKILYHWICEENIQL